MPRAASAVIPAIALACREPADAVPVAASSGVVAGPDRAVVADPDEGEVVVVRAATGEAEALAIGGEPTRIAAVDDLLLVTLRADRALAVLVDDGPGRGLREVDRVEVGPEPVGVVARDDRAWVAVSLAGEVVELDLDAMAVVRRLPVPDEPRWLALDVARRELWVASARGGRLTRIDLGTGAAVHRPLPALGTPPRAVRITGDPCLTDDDGVLAVPALYVDAGVPLPGDPTGEGGPGTASAGPGRLDPVLVLVGVDGQGDLPVLAETRDGGVRRSVLGAATCAPGGRYLVAAMDGSDRVLVVDREPFRTQRADRPRRDGVVPPPDDPGFWERPIATGATPAGPQGAAFDGVGGLWVAALRDRAAAVFRWEDALQVVEAAAERRIPGSDPVLEPAAQHRLGRISLPEDVALGRALFHSAVHPSITLPEGGLACATCHPDGRDDGLTWGFADGPRQTPSLAGGLFGTGPYGWAGDVPTVGEMAERISVTRMGGAGPDPAERHAIEAYLETVRAPDVPARPGDAVVAAGEALFHDPEVGCAGCHLPEVGTDGAQHEVYGGLLADTPHLVGLALTAPYMHDGALATLGEVLEHAATGAMGDASGLDADQRLALERYLRTR